MQMYDGKTFEVPMCRIVFDDPEEFFDFDMLAQRLGMGVDWPILILREYLQSFKEGNRVGDKPFTWDGAE